MPGGTPGNGCGAPTAVLWELGGDPGRWPPVTAAYTLGHLARRAALGLARRLFGPDGLPPCLHGHGPDGAVTRDPRHPNACFLAEDTGGGRIGQILIVAPGGFDRPALAALVMVERLYDGTLGEWPVRCVWVGPAQDAPSRLTRPSRTWISATPWVCPLHLKTGRSLEGMLIRDLSLRGWPPPSAVELLTSVPTTGGSAALARQDFTLYLPTRTGRPRPDGMGSLWRLTFPLAIHGPVTLGWDHHLGLGLFRPDEPEHEEAEETSRDNYNTLTKNGNSV